MNNYSKEITIAKSLQIIGLLYLLALIIPILNYIVVLSRIISPNNILLTARNIINYELLFRIGIIWQVLFAIILMLFSVSMYNLLKQISNTISLFALIVKLSEAFLCLVIVIGQFFVLLLLKTLITSNDDSLGLITSMIGFSINSYISLTYIGGILSGISITTFLVLMLKTKFVHKSIIYFGILANVIVCIYDSLNIMYPEFTRGGIIQIISSAPICVFHFVFGLVLIGKGITLKVFSKVNE